MRSDYFEYFGGMSLNVTVHTYADGYRTNIFTVRATNAVADCFLFHGMLEHHERYREFASHLAENGFNVYVCDLRGAGALAKEQGSYAHLLPNEGFQQMVTDAMHVIEQYGNGLPIFVLGHSFGSLLSRRLGQVMGHRLAGVVAISPPPGSGVIGRIGRFAIDATIRRKGSDYPSRLFERLLFGRYNLKFLPAKTESDWISSDPEEVTSYRNDPHCGGLPTLGYLYEVASASLDVTSLPRIHEHPKTLPLLFVVGADDPVVHDGEGLKGMVRNYQIADIEVTVLSYDGARHEVLRETNRTEVWNDITAWLLQTTSIPLEKTSI